MKTSGCFCSPIRGRDSRGTPTSPQDLLAQCGSGPSHGPAQDVEDWLEDDPELERLHAARLEEMRRKAEARAEDRERERYGAELGWAWEDGGRGQIIIGTSIQGVQIVSRGASYVSVEDFRCI